MPQDKLNPKDRILVDNPNDPTGRGIWMTVEDWEIIQKNRAAYEAMTPEQKAAEDKRSQQRRKISLQETAEELFSPAELQDPVIRANLGLDT